MIPQGEPMAFYHETERLILRDWREADIPLFAKMNADPQVMEFFEKPLSLQETLESVERITRGAAEHGYTFWAAERKSDRQFIGCIGIFHSTYEAHFTPSMEIGWRLDKPYWNMGYATEGARESLRLGFERFNAPEIVAITVPSNLRSRNVMSKLGFTHDPAENFDHPKVAREHPFCEHVLYRLKRERWAKG